MESRPMDSFDKERALMSKGISNQLIYLSIEQALKGCALSKEGLLMDVGCGRGHLLSTLEPYFARYIGVDVMRHPNFPEQQQLVLHNLAQSDIPLPNGIAEVAVACEVTPQLENPRLLFRELVRLVKPGGWVVVTNPNPLSLLSIVTLLTRQRFNAFQDFAYPMMLTPLMEIDLLRMARESGLVEPKIFYTHNGRIAFTRGQYPAFLARWFPRACSDHFGIIAKKPSSAKANEPRTHTARTVETLA